MGTLQRDVEEDNSLCQRKEWGTFPELWRKSVILNRHWRNVVKVQTRNSTKCVTKKVFRTGNGVIFLTRSDDVLNSSVFGLNDNLYINKEEKEMKTTNKKKRETIESFRMK